MQLIISKVRMAFNVRLRYGFLGIMRRMVVVSMVRIERE